MLHYMRDGEIVYICITDDVSIFSSCLYIIHVGCNRSLRDLGHFCFYQTSDDGKHNVFPYV